jgi:hypothetical protein
MSVYQAPDRKCSVVFNLQTYNLAYDTCRRVFLATVLASQLVNKIPRILQNPKAYYGEIQGSHSCAAEDSALLGMLHRAH